MLGFNRGLLGRIRIGGAQGVWMLNEKAISKLPESIVVGNSQLQGLATIGESPSLQFIVPTINML